ncbi:MAG: hypothetical protein IJT34_00740, partial [Butyrivibrio sp.]|nr:hypothetical protein [Butyrivibrio sp.]
MDINLNGFSESGNSPRIDHRGGFGTVAQGAEAPSSAAGTSASGRSAFAVDFDPNRPTMGAYAEKKRSMQEIMDQAGAVDTKNLHNYMNLMANTVSAEDFARAAEEGYDFSEVEPEEAVTILDHIKAAVALSGQEIVGFTDGLSTNQLTQITGSAGMAEAIRSEFARQDLPVTEANVRDVSEAADRLMELPPLSDGAVQYLTENAMTPTIDNLYLAQHSGAGAHRAARGYYAQETGGYYAQTAQETDWEQIAPQAEAVIEDAGYRTAAEKQRMAEEQAKWMVTAGVPLTAANLTQVMELRGLQLPSSMEAAVATATAARASGRPAASGEPGVTESDVRRAARYQEELNNVTDAAVEKVVRNGRPLTLKQLREAERESGNEAGQSGQQEATPEAMEAELLRARKQIEEARLSMSVEANLRLMEWGVKIDTTPMAELIDQLNRAITQIERGLFGTQAAQTADGSPVVETTPAASQGVQEEQQNGRLELFRTSMQRIGALADGPAAVSGAIAGFEMELTLEEIVRTSENVEKRLQAAGTAYESLMTAPRADLGDSIRKAFRNVDDILTDLGFELNDENRRAVRIMGYNHMAMTAEHIEAVRTADRRLTATVGELKPAAVLQLIRDGQDPMGMTLDELRQELSDRQQEENRSEEKYARFLYKLEQNDEITPEERESYIGIYRLFHNLKQTDDAAIGALLRTGAELTIGNLL